MPITISAKRIFFILVIAIIVFVCVHLVSQYLVIRNGIEFDTPLWHALQRLNMDYEISLPTWYSQITIFVAAILLAAVGAIKKRQKARTIGWNSLAVVFVYLSVDEGASLHELLVQPTRDYLNIQGGFLLSAWVVPFMALVALFIVVYIWFWIKLPRRTRLLTAIAAITFVGGAMGMEMIGAEVYTRTDGIFSYESVVHAAIEETLEMAGIAVLIYALLDYIRRLPIKTLPSVKITA